LDEEIIVNKVFLERKAGVTGSPRPFNPVKTVAMDIWPGLFKDWITLSTL